MVGPHFISTILVLNHTPFNSITIIIIDNLIIDIIINLRDKACVCKAV